MLASVTGLRELGFAVAFGVMLDTLLLRTVLVPALVVVLGEISWLPRLGRRPVASGIAVDGELQEEHAPVLVG